MSAAVALIDPKFPHNVGGALRACHVFGAEYLRWTGDRVEDPKVVAQHSAQVTARGYGRRLPREERMRAYRTVDWQLVERPIDGMIRLGFTPVAVEVRDNAEDLVQFVHPEKALYVFGPEDGSLGRATLEACHRFVRIPSDGCLNLAAAVNVVLYDRRAKGTDRPGRRLVNRMERAVATTSDGFGN